MFPRINKVSSMDKESNYTSHSGNDSKTDESNNVEKKRPLSSESQSHPENRSDKSLKSEFVKFLESTSVKGVNKASKSEGITLKILWLLATLFGLGLGIALISVIVIGYLSYEVVTQIAMCDSCTPEFPDITVCKLNALGLDVTGVTYTEYNDILRGLLPNESQLESVLEERGLDPAEYTDLFQDFHSVSGFISNAFSNDFINNLEFRLNKSSLVHSCQW